MADVRNIAQPVRKRVLVPKPVYSRVLTMVVIPKWQGNVAFAISEAFGNKFWVNNVWVRVYWPTVDTTPELYFRLVTGTGKQVDAAIVHAWEPVIPVIYEGTNTSWIADQTLYQFHWSLSKPYEGHGRRLGVWSQMTAGGLSIAMLFASFEVAEG